jgi:hypothetical protein
MVCDVRQAVMLLFSGGVSSPGCWRLDDQPWLMGWALKTCCWFGQWIVAAFRSLVRERSPENTQNTEP